jgi:hypothetical protein
MRGFSRRKNPRARLRKLRKGQIDEKLGRKSRTDWQSVSVFRGIRQVTNPSYFLFATPSDCAGRMGCLGFAFRRFWAKWSRCFDSVRPETLPAILPRAHWTAGRGFESLLARHSFYCTYAQHPRHRNIGSLWPRAGEGKSGTADRAGSKEGVSYHCPHLLPPRPRGGLGRGMRWDRLWTWFPHPDPPRGRGGSKDSDKMRPSKEAAGFTS